MAITDLKLKDSDIAAKGVAAAPTVLNGTPEENKRVFDRLVREVLKGDFNGLIDALTAATGAGEIGAAVEGLTGATVQAILNAIKAALDAKASDAATSAALEGKADKLTISSHIKEVELDSSTGVFTFTRQNGTKITIDTALEKVAVNFAYDKASQSLKLTLADGSTETVPLSDFITVTEFEDSDTLEWSVSADGSKVKATVKAGSITDTMLSSALKGLLAGYVNKAAQAATAAAGSESSALSYKNAAEAAAKDAASSKKTVGDYATAAQQAADDAEGNATAARQSANAASGSAFDAQDMSYSAMLHAEDAEAWAVGQRNGVDVGADDPAYQKSAKYWAEKAAEGGTGGGSVTDEQVSSAVSTWLTTHPEATTTVQDGSVSAKKLEGYHVACRDVPWTLFLDGYKTTTTVSLEEPGCAIYYVKLESGKTYCLSNLPYPNNTNEFVTDPSINYFGYYFGYSTLPDVDANVASNRDRLYGFFASGLINTFVKKAISEGYIELVISGAMPGAVPYYFTVKQDCFLLRASTKPATGQRINNFLVEEVLPGMSDIGNGFAGQSWFTFKKDLGNGYAKDNGYVQQIFASKVATAEKQRAYAAMSRDVPRDRTLNIQFIGDSITYAASNAGLQNSFVKYVSMNLQAQQLRLCQSGVSVTTGGGSFDWNGKPNSSADYNAEMSGYLGLVQKLAEYKSNLSLSVWSDSVDIVVVELGTNDHWEQSVLGAQTDLTADTNFYGAVEKTLTLLEETFPHAQILWLLPFKNQRWKTSTIKLVDYLIALKVICQMHTRCWVLDLTDKWFLDYDDTDLRSSFFIDGVHITGAAHKCVAESMIDKIREIVSVCGTRQIETVHTTDANDSVYGSSST